jgi:proteasome lid subunit RPN8/RPN11
MMVHAQQHPGLEVIGFLLGNINQDTVTVNETVSGEFVAKPTETTFRQKAMARIFQDLVDGKYKDKGKVVGWYHSHPGFGLFLSQTDVNTTVQLQQFDPRVAAIVVEPTTEEIGAFTVADGGVVGVPIATSARQLAVQAGVLPHGHAINSSMSQPVHVSPGSEPAGKPLSQIAMIVTVAAAAAILFGVGGLAFGAHSASKPDIGSFEQDGRTITPENGTVALDTEKPVYLILDNAEAYSHCNVVFMSSNGATQTAVYEVSLEKIGPLQKENFHFDEQSGRYSYEWMLHCSGGIESTGGEEPSQNRQQENTDAQPQTQNESLPAASEAPEASTQKSEGNPDINPAGSEANPDENN